MISGRSRVRICPISLAIICSLIPALLLPAGCAEENNPVGFDQGLRGTSLVTPETLMIAAPSADLEIRPDRSTGTSASLLVGRDETATARALIRFETLPDTAGLRYAYLRLYEKQDQYDQAASAYKTSLQIKANNWDILNNLGIVYFKQGRFDGALDSFQEAVRLKPDFAEKNEKRRG